MDGLGDLTELDYEFDPTHANRDGDLLFDDEEWRKGSDPEAYDLEGKAAAYHAATAGALFGDAWDTRAAKLYLVNKEIASSGWYLLGTLGSGVLVIGDVRDLIYGIGTGAWGTAALSAVGIVPGLGDAAKSTVKFVDFARKSAAAVRAAVSLAHHVLPRGAADRVVETVSGLARATLRQDEDARKFSARSPNFDPVTNSWTSVRPARIGTDPAQQDALDAVLVDLSRRARNGDRVEDVRINQRQVDANGKVRGLNRPDVQYTLNGRRYYIEFDRPMCADMTRSRRGWVISSAY